MKNEAQEEVVGDATNLPSSLGSGASPPDQVFPVDCFPCVMSPIPSSYHAPWHWLFNCYLCMGILERNKCVKLVGEKNDTWGAKK